MRTFIAIYALSILFFNSMTFSQEVMAELNNQQVTPKYSEKQNEIIHIIPKFKGTPSIGKSSTLVIQINSERPLEDVDLVVDDCQGVSNSRITKTIGMLGMSNISINYLTPFLKTGINSIYISVFGNDSLSQYFKKLKCNIFINLKATSISIEENPSIRTSYNKFQLRKQTNESDSLDMMPAPPRSAFETYFGLIDQHFGQNKQKTNSKATVSTTYVQQDYVFDQAYWQDIDVGIKTLLEGAWWVDYDCLVRLSFTPDGSSSGYNLKLYIDPYMVRHATGGAFHFADGYNEYGDFGTPFLGKAIEVKSKGKVIVPGGNYWNIPEISHGNGGEQIWTLNGSKPYGKWNVEIDMWNSSSAYYQSYTFEFVLEDPDQKNQIENGYLVGSGIVLCKSENMIENVDRVPINHYAGTFRYYIDKKNPSKTDNVTYRQVWNRVRNNSDYGSPYNYTPEYMLLMRIRALGEQDTWDGHGIPTNEYANILPPVSANIISNNGIASISTTTEWIISPKIYQTGTNKSFGIAGTFGFNYGNLNSAVTVSGNATTNYIILPTPVSTTFNSYPITISPTGIIENPNHNLENYSIEQNYPNPFNPITTVQYDIPVRSNVLLSIYNILGQRMAVLISGIQEPGKKSVQWNAISVPSGIYFYSLDATSISNPSKHFTQNRKMIVLK
ncbi:MAG: T9SS type A sorting domain-containing protein [Bacteroidota bacterium]